MEGFVEYIPHAGPLVAISIYLLLRRDLVHLHKCIHRIEEQVKSHDLRLDNHNISEVEHRLTINNSIERLNTRLDDLERLMREVK